MKRSFTVTASNSYETMCAVMSLPCQQLLFVIILLSALSIRGQAAQDPRFSSPDKQSLQVFLTVSDKHGSPARPDQSELRVSVDKQAAQISVLRSAKTDPLLFAVVVDTSRSNARSADAIRTAALQLFQGLATEHNQGYLVLFNVSAAISARPLQVSEAQKLLELAGFGGGTAVYDAIEQTCIQKLSRSGNPNAARRVMLLISDGEDNQSHVTPTKAQEEVEKEGVAVFSLVTRSAEPQGSIFCGRSATRPAARQSTSEI